MLVSARSFDEYRAMFALSDHDLSLRILDCPGGAASFVAVAGARGTDAVAVDPQYAHGTDRLGALVLKEIDHKHAALVANASDFLWTWFEDVENYTRLRTEAARTFAADAAARPDRYLAASLPRLPFADRSFDLVLSSHLLFSYGAQLDEEFHLNSLIELARVARREVRLFPLVLHTSDRPYEPLDRIRHELAGHGIATRLQQVDYAFQRGADRALVLDCTDHRALPRAKASTPAGSGGSDPVRWRHLGAHP
ncbi:methyltransferase domain-containing protein [Kitasatospora sp. NPDC058218]|uniref:methyltransferase domain-containing protein n=1 Tax=Kitasatospora sp. NPDC058218 TaxID=3346385 RepID=UPI0036DE6E60